MQFQTLTRIDKFQRKTKVWRETRALRDSQIYAEKGDQQTIKIFFLFCFAGYIEINPHPKLILYILTKPAK